MINKDIQYVYNFKEVNGSFVYPVGFTKDIVTLEKIIVVKTLGNYNL